MAKYYFRDDNDENCYTESSILEQMGEEGLKELKVFEAKKETGVGYFYCKATGESGDSTKDSCGKFCNDYKPRNGKSGICREYGYCYEQTDKFKILTIN